MLRPMESRRRSIFLTTSVVAAAALGLAATTRALKDPGTSELAWAGGALAALGYAAYFVQRALFPPARARRLPLLLVVPVAWGGVLALFAVGDPVARWSARAIFALVVAATYVALRRAPRLARPPSALAVGAPLPPFSLRAVDGGVRAVDAYAGAPLAWLFFRGDWSAACVAQLQAFAARADEFAARGARIVAVSPQSARHARATTWRLGKPIEVLVDEGAAAARALGLLDAGGVPLLLDAPPFGYGRDTVLPTTIVVDREGVVRWFDDPDDLRVRASVDDVLAALDALPPPPVDAQGAIDAASLSTSTST